MLAVVLGMTTVVCAVGWLTRYISAATLIWYMKQKNIPFPSKAEMRRGSEWVVSHMFKDLCYRRNKH